MVKSVASIGSARPATRANRPFLWALICVLAMVVIGLVASGGLAGRQGLSASGVAARHAATEEDHPERYDLTDLRWLQRVKTGVRVEFVREHEDAATKGAFGPSEVGITSLGQLEGYDLEYAEGILSGLVETANARLGVFQAKLDPSKPFDAYKEAELLLEAEEALSARIALRRGHYYVVDSTAPEIRLPDCGSVSMGCTFRGERKRLVLLMPYSEYPELGALREYVRSARSIAAASAIAEFNALPESQRKQLLQQYKLLKESPTTVSIRVREQLERYFLDWHAVDWESAYLIGR